MNYTEEIFSNYASDGKIDKNGIKKIIVGLDIDLSTVELVQDQYNFDEFEQVLNTALKDCSCKKDSFLNELSSTDSTFVASNFKSKTVSTSNIDLFFAEAF